ncbi:hypothetical protein QE177_14500 (plasmid) [Arsenophonus sp. aPb]|nr:hypothetical protein [Arsenophonus sp. aPb]WGL99799.1 hypothetical protein QE177_14500 [Arsenophonus sp. aPb]
MSYIRHCCKDRDAAALFVDKGLTFQRLDSLDASHPEDGQTA